MGLLRNQRRLDRKRRKREARKRQHVTVSLTDAGRLALLFSGPNVHFKCEACGIRREDPALEHLDRRWKALCIAGKAELSKEQAMFIEGEMELVVLPDCTRCGDKLSISVVGSTEEF